jgi:small subunit ribosomal protein S1
MALSVEGFLWSNFLKHAPMETSSNVRLEQQRLYSAQKTLPLVKARLEGRTDISSKKSVGVSSVKQMEVQSAEPVISGEFITGRVIDMDDNGATLEIGGKMSGFIPIREVALLPVRHMSEVLEMGQEVTGSVLGWIKGMPVISLRTQALAGAWEDILKARAADITFDVEVMDVNKGGAVCSAFGVRAFLPGSHFEGMADESMIGSFIKVKFLDVVEAEGKVVVSQRRASGETRAELKRGDVLPAVVTGLRNYGAFVEVEGGTAGLLHISQISYDRIENLETLFTIGQSVKVMVIDFDKATGKVALSTKTLEPNPGDMLRDMASVFEKAEATAKLYHERVDAERVAREAASKDIVAGLSNAISGSSGENNSGSNTSLITVADSIESILASIVGDNQDSK